MKAKISKQGMRLEARICSSILSRLRGMMFTSKPELLFFDNKIESRESFHMMFMFFSIDIVFLNSKGKVVDMKENFRPWTFYTPKKPARYALEAPTGTIQSEKISIGDVLKIEKSI